MGRRYYSPTTRQRAIALVLDEHIPVAQAAREIGCSPITINNWIEKYRPADRQPTEQVSFVPIQIVDFPSQSIEIVTPAGFVIRLSDATPQYLAKLLQALAPPC